MKSAFDGAKRASDSKKAEGEGLIAQAARMPGWDDLLVRIDSVLPDPPRELGLDAGVPQDLEVIQKLRIHVDAILPRYRTDLATDWFNAPELEGFPKDYMHPYDRANPPAGEGWVVQIIGHHYNPSPIGAQAARLPEQIRKAHAYGPVNYLTQRVIPRLWTPEMRRFGTHHATLVWVEIDDRWVTTKAANGSPLPAAPILARPTVPAKTTGGGMGGSSDMMTAYGRSGMGGADLGSRVDMAENMALMMSSYYSGQMMGGPGAAGKNQPEETTLIRTNFMIQFLWQPREPGAEPPQIEAIQKALDEAAKGQGTIRPVDIKVIVAKSQQLLQKKLREQLKATTGATAPGPGTPASDPAATTPSAAVPPAATSK